MRPRDRRRGVGRARAWWCRPRPRSPSPAGPARRRGRRSPPSAASCRADLASNPGSAVLGSARTTAPPCTFSSRPCSCSAPRSRRIVMSETPQGRHQVADPDDAVALELGAGSARVVLPPASASPVTTATSPAGDREPRRRPGGRRTRSCPRTSIVASSSSWLIDEDPATPPSRGTPGAPPRRTGRRRPPARPRPRRAAAGPAGRVAAWSSPAGDVPGGARAVRVPGDRRYARRGPVDVRRDGWSAPARWRCSVQTSATSRCRGGPGRRCAAGRNSSTRMPSRSRKAPG